jgi:hypothetical protein
MKVFIVLHHEIMGTPEDCRADEMVFYTCDSLKKAINLIRKSSVDRWSWWEIQSQELNNHDWPEHVGYYGLRGGKLAKAPYEKCVELFKKARSKP